MEDVDTPRCVPGADQTILQQLKLCGLVSDAPVMYQSQRGDAYQAALDRLIAKGWAYPCGCSRKEIEDAQAQLGHTANATPLPSTLGLAVRAYKAKPHALGA